VGDGGGLMTKTEHYSIPVTWIPDLIHRLSEAVVTEGAASSVTIELEMFNNGDVNVIVAGRMAATLKKSRKVN
jgi:hypothetical protein